MNLFGISTLGNRIMVHREIARRSTRGKVLLVVRWPVGGIRTFLKYVLPRFPEGDFDFTFIGLDGGSVRSLQADLGGLVTKWVLFPADGREFASCMKAVRDELRKGRYDLIHAHGFTSVIACSFLGVFNRIPVLFTSHDVIHANQFYGWKGNVKRVGLGLSLIGCRRLHFVSHDAKINLITHFRFLEKKSEVIVNGVNSMQFRVNEELDLYNEYGIDKSCKIIGFFGRFMSQKGFKYLVEAVDKILRSDVDLNIKVVCFGSGEFFREEKHNIESKGLEEYFVFSPFLEDVSGAMKGCDLIAMPSLWEACPLQPMEALCAGVPFVGSDCIGLREVLAGTPAIQVKAGDSDSLAKGILECLEVGRKPFEDFAPIAVDRFDIRKTAEGIHALYEKVLG